MDTDADGLASCEVTPGSGGVNWTITAHDAADKEMSQRSVNLPCGPALHDFLLRTDRGVYESGQTMRLTADGGGHQPVFVDILKGDQTLLSETIEMTEGRGTFAFDLPPDLFGTVRLCAYRLDANGVMLSKTRVVYIRPAGQLKIASKLDQKEYRPGRRAHLDLTLTDTEGKPCPGAISLAGVDEAVFSVLSQRPGSEETFYTVERQLLQPVYSLYPWSPQRTARDGGRLEQALFAATVRSEVKNSASGVHTLTVASLPGKVAEIERERATGREWMRLSWLGLALLTVALGYIALWCFLRPMTVIILHFAALLTVPPAFCILVANVMLSSAKEGAAPVGASSGGSGYGGQLRGWPSCAGRRLDEPER